MTKRKSFDSISDEMDLINIKNVAERNDNIIKTRSGKVLLLEIMIELKDLEIKSKNELISHLQVTDENRNKRIIDKEIEIKQLEQMNAYKDAKIQQLEQNNKSQIQATFDVEKKMYLASTVIAAFLESM